MRGTTEIIKKELTRVFSDRKLIISLFILPAVLIVGIYYFIGQMQTTMMNDINEHKSIVYLMNAPEDIKDIINASGYYGDINYIDKNTDVTEIKDGILHGSVDLLVEFEDGFLDKINNSSEVIVPEIKTYYNNSEDYSSVARDNFVNNVLGTYKQELLVDRFGDINIISIFDVDRDPSTSIIVDNDKASGKAFGMLLPYFLTFMLFQGAMSLGIDAITGEKERGTMASMLLTPLKRKEIVMGKIISIAILSCLSALVYAVSMIVSLPVLFNGVMGDSSGMVVNFTPTQILMLLLIILTLVYLYVSIVTLTSVLAKTAKEAGTYLSPIYIIVLVAGMITMFTSNSDPTLSMYAIPVYGSAISIQGILSGDLTLLQFALTIAGSIGFSAILTAIITKAFNSEKVMFNA